MYKIIVILAALAAVVLAAPPKSYNSPNEIPIISQESIVNEDGSFRYSYESGDGTRAEESGQLKALGPNEQGQAVQGSFSFIGADGASYTVTYTADENGFLPQAAHLPVAPPIPEAILKALEYNRAHPEEDNLRK